MQLSEWFKKYARDFGVKVAEAAKVEMRRMVSTPYPPASTPGHPPHTRRGEQGLLGYIRVVKTANGARLVVAKPYASFLQQGTRNMRARPFYYEAVNNVLRNKFKSRRR